MASYVVFSQTTATSSHAEALQAPDRPGVQFQDMVGVWIAGSGGDLSIIDGAGGPAPRPTQDVIGKAVDLNSYP